MTRASRELAAARACVGFALRKAARTVTRRYDAELRASGMKSTQFNLLVVLDATGPISTTALAGVTAIERTTLTRNLAILARRAWVRAEPSDDRRTRMVSITARGRAAALAALPAWRRTQASLATTLGPRQLAELMAHLDRLLGRRP